MPVYFKRICLTLAILFEIQISILITTLGHNLNNEILKVLNFLSLTYSFEHIIVLILKNSLISFCYLKNLKGSKKIKLQ